MKFPSFSSPLPLCILAKSYIYDQRACRLSFVATYSSKNTLRHKLQQIQDLIALNIQTIS